ncbi:MAG: class I SAM-dependent methyltransferase [Chloroflexi bacterium]|nr:class I SAM-dependent methyltransferase [Chloroflexota bacterium]
MNVLDQYVTSAPLPQNAIDIFKGEWHSELPDASLLAGSITLFDDYRIKWFTEHLGGFQNRTVLELGPLEAGHTYMLERLGAASILSIEASTRAFLKCLIIKEIFDLGHTRFLCGDFVEYLRTNHQQFDVCLASGVLYHMTNPIELVALLAKTTNHVCLWTHYYDPKIVQPLNSQKAEHAGFAHTLYYRPYGEGLECANFCGGCRPHSYWMTRDDLINGFKHFGLTEITIGIEEPNHPNGPAFTLIASRPSGAD